MAAFLGTSHDNERDATRPAIAITCYGTQEAERVGRGAGGVVVQHALAGRLGQGDGQRDGFVELSPARLDGHDGRDGHAVAEQLRGQLGRDRLSLDKKMQKVKIK